MIQAQAFSKKLLDWYHINKRDLPWRNITDPYKIWLSEVILQQTRVAQGLPYYEKFINEYPTIHDLASADESQVLRTWQGLGYYSRARNLHRCAQYVVENHDGKFPNTFDTLLKLPGIGPYTAAAIASFSFKEKVAVVDGNVYRVLSRIFGIETDISSSQAYKVFKEKASELIDEKEPDHFNQALMEFGATVCNPKNPECSNCIFNKDCFANNNGLKSQLPVKLKKTKTRKRYFTYLVFRFNDQLFLNKREAKDIWQNMYDFKLIETESKLNTDNILSLNEIEKIKDQISQVDISKEYKHILSHQNIYAQFVEINLKSNSLDFDGKWYSKKEILELPKPVLISTYLQEYIF